uniref:Coiled-coil domain-containing protein 22 n=1 Tax=Corvus moneduloides TaxID=1196302 RepID=A0A8U7NG05_CORMO
MIWGSPRPWPRSEEAVRVWGCSGRGPHGRAPSPPSQGGAPRGAERAGPDPRAGGGGGRAVPPGRAPRAGSPPEPPAAPRHLRTFPARLRPGRGLPGAGIWGGRGVPDVPVQLRTRHAAPAPVPRGEAAAGRGRARGRAPREIGGAAPSHRRPDPGAAGDPLGAPRVPHGPAAAAAGHKSPPAFRCLSPGAAPKWGIPRAAGVFWGGPPPRCQHSPPFPRRPPRPCWRPTRPSSAPTTTGRLSGGGPGLASRLPPQEYLGRKRLRARLRALEPLRQACPPCPQGPPPGPPPGPCLAPGGFWGWGGRGGPAQGVPLHPHPAPDPRTGPPSAAAAAPGGCRDPAAPEGPRGGERGVSVTLGPPGGSVWSLWAPPRPRCPPRSPGHARPARRPRSRRPWPGWRLKSRGAGGRFGQPSSASPRQRPRCSRAGGLWGGREDTLRVKARALELLPDAQNNMAKLQLVVESSSRRIVSLAGQWERHRGPLLAEFRHLRALRDSAQRESSRRLAETQALLQRSRAAAEEARRKETLHAQLVAELEALPRDVSRAVYTQRILEIVGNIRKQKEEIGKILEDTRALQKEINALVGKLERTFSVTDELLFKDAKRDEVVRKAYKYLAALHENCAQLIRTIEDTGTIQREIRDLEEQIEGETSAKLPASLERILSDCRALREENALLAARARHA